MLYYVIGTLIMSLLTFFAYGVDKHKAIKHKRRIPEKTLITLGLCLGSVGAILGMVLFRHKTNKLKFKLFNSVFLILHLLLGFYIYSLSL